MAQVERSLPRRHQRQHDQLLHRDPDQLCDQGPEGLRHPVGVANAIFVLLAAFIFMVSRQMLSLEEGEIAVLKSRGASKRQILFVYLLQSLLLALLSLVLGLPLGLYLCQVLGSANAFLEFVQRTALPVSLDLEVLLYGLAAALVSTAAWWCRARYADVSS